MAREWIFTGNHNLRGPTGEIIAPWTPFHAPRSWFERYHPRTSHIGRRILTLTDYEARLEKMDLRSLLNQTRIRELSTHPVPVDDAQHILRPQQALDDFGADPELCERYGVHFGVTKLGNGEAKTQIAAAVTEHVCAETGQTVDEIRHALIETLMAPLFAALDEVEEEDGERLARLGVS